MRKPAVVKQVYAIVTGRHNLLVPSMDGASPLRHTVLPIRFSRRKITDDFNLDAGKWLQCDEFLSMHTPTWIARLNIEDSDRLDLEKKFEEDSKNRQLKRWDCMKEGKNGFEHYIDESNIYHVGFFK